MWGTSPCKISAQLLNCHGLGILCSVYVGNMTAPILEGRAFGVHYKGFMHKYLLHEDCPFSLQCKEMAGLCVFHSLIVVFQISLHSKVLLCYRSFSLFVRNPVLKSFKLSKNSEGPLLFGFPALSNNKNIFKIVIQLMQMFDLQFLGC